MVTFSADNWSTDSDSSDAEKLSREKSRGAFVSVVQNIILNLVGAFMFHIGVREGLVVTNYGFILGPVIGFILDQSVGSDAGFKNIGYAAYDHHTLSSHTYTHLHNEPPDECGNGLMSDPQDVDWFPICTLVFDRGKLCQVLSLLCLLYLDYFMLHWFTTRRTSLSLCVCVFVLCCGVGCKGI